MSAEARAALEGGKGRGGKRALHRWGERKMFVLYPTCTRAAVRRRGTRKELGEGCLRGMCGLLRVVARSGVVGVGRTRSRELRLAGLTLR